MLDFARSACPGLTEPKGDNVLADVEPQDPSIDQCEVQAPTHLAGIHASHRIKTRNDVHICDVCGAYGSRMPYWGLAKLCPQAQTSGGKAALARWAKGLHPHQAGVFPAVKAQLDFLEIIKE